MIFGGTIKWFKFDQSDLSDQPFIEVAPPPKSRKVYSKIQKIVVLYLFLAIIKTIVVFDFIQPSLLGKVYNGFKLNFNISMTV